MVMDQNCEVYREEATELLVELEETLLELEETPDNEELIGRAFRAMHTIKGSGAMFGFEDVAEFTHGVETVYDLVRDGIISVTKNLVDLSLKACDQIKKMIDNVETDEDEIEAIVMSFHEIILSSDKQNDQVSVSEVQNKESGGTATFRIVFKPLPEIFANGTNPLLLLDELRGLGSSKIVAHPCEIPLLKDLNPESCYMYWDIILTTDGGTEAIKEVFMFTEDECNLSIDVIDEQGVLYQEADFKKLGEILVERGDVTAGELRKMLGVQRRLGDLLVEENIVTRDVVDSALAEQEQIKEACDARQKAVSASSVRVTANKLDSLVDLVGELVTVQARLSQKTMNQDDPELVMIAEEVERLTVELRDNTMDIRMLPIGSTFSKFKRLVRDLSGKLGKEIDLKTEGGETELDKTVIDRLDDPLVHLIRNSIDHGVEMPDERKDMGKSEKGTITLKAAHRGANVIITIIDDGKGLDVDAIRAKAVKKGQISEDDELTDNEILMQIFAAGFSTADTISDVSGRGVGMDVVKRCTESLRGTVEISSEKTVGTAISLKLPLTLAIIDGLLVGLDESFYVVPLSTVEECVELTKEKTEETNGRHILNVRGEAVPYIPLREMFGIQNKAPDPEHIVIAEVNGSRFGIVVDKVIGGHQTVIKSLGKVYKDAKGLSGATIMADGTVALILDVHRLVELARVEEINARDTYLH